MGRYLKANQKIKKVLTSNTSKDVLILIHLLNRCIFFAPECVSSLDFWGITLKQNSTSCSYSNQQKHLFIGSFCGLML
jgi:hypothetical protein